MDVLLRGAPRGHIVYGLRQSLYHARALGFEGPPIESRLARILEWAEGTIETDWTEALRVGFASEIAQIRQVIGELANANQPDFDPGPMQFG
jgi:hypothetical protein